MKHVIQKSNQPVNIFNGANVNVKALFEQAVSQANAGLKLLALETAREALIYAKRQSNEMQVRIHRFLAFLSMDFMKFDQAKIHCWQAMSALNRKNAEYDIEREVFELMLEKINAKANTDFERFEIAA